MFTHHQLTMQPRVSMEDLNEATALAWLLEDGKFEDASFEMGQDWDLMFAGVLSGGLTGHLRAYLELQIPSARKKQFLLDTLFILTRDYLGRSKSSLCASADIAEALELASKATQPEIKFWAKAVQRAWPARSSSYRFWCQGGWQFHYALTKLFRRL